MTKLRIVSYAINGRGMGHLVRQLSILRWIRRLTEVLGIRAEIWVLTTSEADTLARREGFASLKMPSKAMMRDAGMDPHRYLAVARTWVLNTIAGLAPDLLLVDTFPAGSFGELISVLELAKHRVLVARRVRPGFGAQDGYQALLPLYQRQIIPDDRGTGPILIRERSELLDRRDARAALGAIDDARMVYVSFGGGGDVQAAQTLPRIIDVARSAGNHVVVGAGPLYTGPERREPGVTWMDRYVPLDLFNGFDAAVSAGGYNAFHELMYAGVPTVFWPQDRIADDQLERCQRAADAGAGRVVSRLDDIAGSLAAPGSRTAAAQLVPTNGARAAAVAALETMLPAADLRAASDLMNDGVLHHLARLSPRSAATGELVQCLAGPSPSERAARSALIEELEARGKRSAPQARRPRSADVRIGAFLETLAATEIPVETSLALLRGLRKKFPIESLDEVAASCETLLRCWAPFNDWMGAVSLLRAVPIQRRHPLAKFVSAVCAWLADEDDLFDALREFSQLENGGERSVDEVLEMLTSTERRRRPEERIQP